MGETSVNDANIMEVDYKPRSETSYETLMLTKSDFNSKIKGAGFRKDGKPRQIKKETLLAKLRTRSLIREKRPAIAICITMYNEEEVELKATLKGLIHNYNCLRAEQDRYNLQKDDFLICIVCDGYDKIPDSFKKFARDKGFLDEDTLVDQGFMDKDEKTGNYKFKNLSDVMDENLTED